MKSVQKRLISIVMAAGIMTSFSLAISAQEYVNKDQSGHTNYLSETYSVSYDDLAKILDIDLTNLTTIDAVQKLKDSLDIQCYTQGTEKIAAVAKALGVDTTKQANPLIVSNINAILNNSIFDDASTQDKLDDVIELMGLDTINGVAKSADKIELNLNTMGADKLIEIAEILEINTNALNNEGIIAEINDVLSTISE